MKTSIWYHIRSFRFKGKGMQSVCYLTGLVCVGLKQKNEVYRTSIYVWAQNKTNIE